jgi:hypothetical protein
MSVSNWMSWEGGVDLVAMTAAGLPMPNVIVHVARIVHTPVGSAPAGMILYQPDPKGAPLAMGFISPDAKVAAYFGPKIFAGTPFEQAPALTATIEIKTDLPKQVTSKVTVAGHTFEVTLSDLTALELINRPPGQMTPFTQQGPEAAAGKATLTVDGKPVSLILPPQGISGGAAAVWSPAGIYAR